MILNDVNTGIHELRRRKRVGRGTGSGRGKTCGRGHKGFFSRAGSSSREGYEGGQMPLFRKVAKRGFNNNAFRDLTVTINVSSLGDNYERGAAIGPDDLVMRGLIPTRFHTLKILGSGALTIPLTVSAHQFSASAEEKIRSAGGQCLVIS